MEHGLGRLYGFVIHLASSENMGGGCCGHEERWDVRAEAVAGSTEVDSGQPKIEHRIYLAWLLWRGQGVEARVRKNEKDAMQPRKEGKGKEESTVGEKREKEGEECGVRWGARECAGMLGLVLGALESVLGMLMRVLSFCQGKTQEIAGKSRESLGTSSGDLKTLGNLQTFTQKLHHFGPKTPKFIVTQ